jgi:hypothetical protein
MPRILVNVENIKRVTVWVDERHWDELAKIVPNRSDFIRTKIMIELKKKGIPLKKGDVNT